jgi:hypothetical protein
MFVFKGINRTSENAVKAKFAEFPFYEVGRIRYGGVQEKTQQPKDEGEDYARSDEGSGIRRGSGYIHLLWGARRWLA